MDDIDIAVLAQLRSLIYSTSSITEIYTTDGDDEPQTTPDMTC